MRYVVLFNFTDQGIKTIKDSPNRLKKARELFQQTGVEVKDFYMVMGRYDTVFIIEAPNNETMVKSMLAIGSLGNVRSETLCAFDEGQYQKICSSLP